jgi:pSer/pThr/pTyr-binding forkhead associated (FHA) protein
MSMATLYQIGDEGSRAERWEIDEEPVVVGRSGQARVSIEDEGLSRRHFLIRRDGGDYVIKDLNSRNGTWVDGQRVFAEKLHHNDHILAGRTRFLFADRPVLSTTIGKPLTGPHGTVMIRAAPEPERSISEPILWQRESGNEIRTTPKAIKRRLNNEQPY